jgi:putative two-component system response regulator
MQKILVVDDAEWNRELLHEILKDEYMVEMAENGMQAMEKLQDAREEVAALLLDLHMPRMDG